MGRRRGGKGKGERKEEGRGREGRREVPPPIWDLGSGSG